MHKDADNTYIIGVRKDGYRMIKTGQLKENLMRGTYDEKLLDIYVDESKLAYQKERYVKAVETYEAIFGEGEVAVYSAPGRSEIGGNHTDHQHGEVLAASINLDAIAIVKPLPEAIVKVVSGDYDMITISLDDIALKENERESTTALIKGVLAGISDRGYKIGGFQAYIISDVLIGAGLSSSAAFETIIGAIESGLYNDMAISDVEIARIGQYAENVYFGKPCGLMDQMACSVGNLVHIDFADPENPIIEKVVFDMNHHGYSLCITDTKGSHADLTTDYAAVPAEMKKVAAYFGKEVLHDVTMEELLADMDAVRDYAGDRAVLRAIHFFQENERVKQEVNALQTGNIDEFMQTVKASGDSSYKYLQNIYSSHDTEHQNISLALAISEMVLKNQGVCRVHGGGFAGTIQAFVKNDMVIEYQMQMNAIFGENACKILKIRKYGGIKVLE